MDRVDLMLLGHLAQDEVVIGGETRQRVGGAVFFGAFAARAVGASCLVVTKIARADQPVLEVFTAAGIEVHVSASAHTAGIRNVYTTADQDRRTCHLLHAGDPFRLEDLPPHQPTILHLGGLLAGQIPEALIPPLASRAPLGLDLQGFLRVEEGDTLQLRPWAGAASALAHVTYLKADAAEAEVLTGETDLDRAARALAALGPREIVLTHAEGVRVLVDGVQTFAPLDPAVLEGRTGRGDTCMCAYLSARALGRPPEWAARYAAALTSIKLESDGPFHGEYAAVLARMR